MRILTFLLLLLCVAHMGCRESSTNQQVANSQQAATDPASASNSNQANVQSSPQMAVVKPKLDACALLTGSDIESVQGENVKETKLSGQNLGGYSISQCFYTLPTFTNSISLMVAQKGDGAGAKDPKEFWEESFHERSERKGKKSKEEEGEEEEEESAPPKKVSGIGDEAFWTGNSVAGALYVLKGNAYIRLSIGGPPNEASMKRSKTLAQRAIARL